MTTISETTPAPTPWRDILDGDWWKTGRAECGCETWAHVCCDLTWADMSPVSATLHDASTCVRGEHRAEVETALAYELGLRIPAGAGPADVVMVDRDRLVAAQATVAERERAAAASRSQDFVQRCIAAISDRVADESFNAWYATVDGQPFSYVEAKLREVADHPVFEARMYAGYLAAEQAKPLPNPTKVSQFLAAVAAHTERGRREAEDLLNPAAAVARTVADWDLPLLTPAPGVAPAVPAPLEAAPIAPAPVVDRADDPDGLALVVGAAEAERAAEYGALFAELAPALLAQRVLDIPNEIAALLALTIADRAEAVAALRSGRMARLDLVPSDLLPTARGNRAAWTRLREGTAGTWSMADLLPFSDAELDALMNPERPEPKYGHLFYDRGVQILAGSGGIGKTWIALNSCLDAVPAVPQDSGVRAVYLDLDQNFELYSRLDMFGLARAHIRNRTLSVLNVPRMAADRGASTVGMLWAILAGLESEAVPPNVVVVDSLTRILSAVDEGNSNDNDAATRVLSRFDALAQRSAVVILDHTGHEADRPRGASAKIDAVRQVVTVAETKFDAERNPGVIGGGKLISTKDRDGGVRAAYRDPADQSARPELGLMPIIKDPATGRFRVDLIPAAVMAGARERRESAGGRVFAAVARNAILEIVDAAARAAVTADAAKAVGGRPIPPLSARQIEETAWPILAENTLGGKRSDVRAEIKAMCDAAVLVEYPANWGSVPGKRLRVKGSITNGVLDPVDLAALADPANML